VVAVFAVVGVFAFVAIAEHGAVLRAFRAIGRDGLVVAGLMAVSSGAFIVALNYTTVANVLFMQALAPVLAAVLGTFVGEPVARRTWVAMTVAVLGVGLMVGGPDHPSLPSPLSGEQRHRHEDLHDHPEKGDLQVRVRPAQELHEGAVQGLLTPSRVGGASGSGRRTVAKRDRLDLTVADPPGGELVEPRVERMGGAGVDVDAVGRIEGPAERVAVEHAP
jgi:hypothetical protein